MVTVVGEAEEGVEATVMGTEINGTGELDLAVGDIHEVQNGSPVKTEAEVVVVHGTVLPLT